MGLDITVDADETFDEILKKIDEMGYRYYYSECWKGDDGKVYCALDMTSTRSGGIKGIIYEVLEPEKIRIGGRIRKVGEYYIDSNGRIRRFPKLPKEIVKILKEEGKW